MVEPRLELPLASQEATRSKLEAEIKELEQRMKTSTPELAAAQQEWEKSIAAAEAGWRTLVPEHIEAAGGITFANRPDGSVLVSGANPRSQVYEIDAKANVAGITGIRLEAIPDPSLPREGPGRDVYGNFFLSDFEAVVASSAKPGKFEPVRSRRSWPTTAGSSTSATISFGSWMDPARTAGCRGQNTCSVSAAPFGKGETRLRIRLRHESQFSGQSIGHFRLSVTSLRDPWVVAGVSHKLRPVLATAPEKRTEAERREVAEYYLSVAPALKPARERLAEARDELLRDLGIVTTLVMGESTSADRPAANMRLRGAYLSKGDLVYANTPAVLPPVGAGERPRTGSAWRAGWSRKIIP